MSAKIKMKRKIKKRNKNKPWLYCPKCKEYPMNIKEVYLEQIVETRVFDEACGYYNLENTNFDDVEFEERCAYCGTKLEFHKKRIKK